MLHRFHFTAALGIRGVRSYYGKMIPDHTLEMVQVFHRHGDRTPLLNYLVGTDHEKEEVELWKQYLPTKAEFDPIYNRYKHEFTKPNEPCDPVFGQLTRDGVKQMQDVGRQLRKFYFEEEKLLNDSSFNSTEVSLRSTCRDRTLHSLQSLLSTLFPIEEYKDSYPIIKISSDDTCCLNRYDSKCQEACSQRMNSYDWVECLDKMKEDCLPTVVKALPFFADPKNLKWTSVMDYVVTRYSHFLDIDEGIYNLFSKIYRHNVNKFNILYNTPKCLKSFTDDLFAMIKKEADEVISGTNKTKLSIYSCHDTSVMPILTVLTPFLPCDVPPYAANICIEYWKNQFDNSFDVALRYNGEYQPIFIEHYVESIVGTEKGGNN
ncbi:hypothetical protein WA171_001927 [Blastocystis sp. BT1]